MGAASATRLPTLMKRYLKLAAFILLGFATTCLSFALLGLLAGLFGSDPTPSPQSRLSIVFIFTLSFFGGGAVTGYLGSQYVTTKRGLAWINPGFYFLLLDAAIFVHYADKMGLPGLPEAMALIGLAMFLVSWAGVGVGHYVKREILTDRQSNRKATNYKSD
jgi:hypothetical protein